MKMFMSGVAGGISECINKTNLPDMNREFRKLMAFQEYRNRPHKSCLKEACRTKFQDFFQVKLCNQLL